MRPLCDEIFWLLTSSKAVNRERKSWNLSKDWVVEVQEMSQSWLQAAADHDADFLTPRHWAPPQSLFCSRSESLSPSRDVGPTVRRRRLTMSTNVEGTALNSIAIAPRQTDASELMDHLSSCGHRDRLKRNIWTLVVNRYSQGCDALWIMTMSNAQRSAPRGSSRPTFELAVAYDRLVRN